MQNLGTTEQISSKVKSAGMSLSWHNMLSGKRKSTTPACNQKAQRDGIGPSKVGDQDIIDDQSKVDSLAKYFGRVQRVDSGGPGVFVLDISLQVTGDLWRKMFAGSWKN